MKSKTSIVTIFLGYFLIFFLPAGLQSQVTDGLVSSYYFSGNAIDKVRGHHGRVQGARLGTDRFGNSSAAYCFDGEDDYISLGIQDDLKRPRMSISVWAKINEYSGNSLHYDGFPFVFTRARNTDQYYEAYILGVNLSSKKIAGANTSLAQDQTGCLDRKTMKLDEWYHIVYMFDSDTSSLFVNGELQQKNYKGFFSNYLPTDSVVLGYVGNYHPDSVVYNYSWLNGCLDDLKFYGRLLTPEEVMELYNEPDPRYAGKADPFITKNQLFQLLKKYWFFPAAICLFMLYIFFRIKRRENKRKQEYEKKQLQHEVIQMEMKALRSQMNPHFIFNALNSIQKFIFKNERDLANTYLTKFSQLVRNILEFSEQELISLQAEIDTIKLYLDIESMRFRNAFEYKISFSDDVDILAVRVPPLLIQPFVENAIWHGLLLKDGKKELSINIRRESSHIVVEIDDNGIGREAAKLYQEKEVKRKSFGMKITQERIDVLKKLSGIDIWFRVVDKKNEYDEAEGTKVIIHIQT